MNAGWALVEAIIAHAVWLYFRFPLSLRLVEEMPLERGIVVSYETVRRWAMKFGRDYARRLKRKRASRRDIWHLDEVVVTIGGKQHWLWRAVDQDGYILDEIVQTRRDTKAADASSQEAGLSAQEAGLSAQAHDYRQARLLCRSPAPDHARDRAFRRLSKTVQTDYPGAHDGSTPTLDFALETALDALGLPCRLPLGRSVAHVPSQEASRLLDRAFRATACRRRHLVPLDHAGELPELTFGPAMLDGRFSSIRDVQLVLGPGAR